MSAYRKTFGAVMLLPSIHWQLTVRTVEYSIWFNALWQLTRQAGYQQNKKIASYFHRKLIMNPLSFPFVRLEVCCRNSRNKYSENIWMFVSVIKYSFYLVTSFPKQKAFCFVLYLRKSHFCVLLLTSYFSNLIFSNHKEHWTEE